jgi:hypothetical protein
MVETRSFDQKVTFGEGAVDCSSLDGPEILKSRVRGDKTGLGHLGSGILLGNDIWASRLYRRENRAGRHVRSLTCSGSGSRSTEAEFGVEALKTQDLQANFVFPIPSKDGPSVYIRGKYACPPEKTQTTLYIAPQPARRLPQRRSR